ncbi:MAG: hypothetical protein JW772_02530 [Candidatus Diapherotrites archaeon]|nr:hypothetical protein [Candidatus Diapherotrites archaeon]
MIFLSEHKTSLKCPACGKGFPEGVNTSMDLASGVMETTCPFCNKRFEINNDTVVEE